MTNGHLPILTLAATAAPTTGQVLWVLVGLVLLGIGLGLTWSGFSVNDARLRRIGRAAALLGLLVDLAMVLLRSVVWRRNCPIDDNFDSVLLFTVLLGGVLFYLVTTYRRPIRRSGSAPPPAAPPRRSIIDLVLLPLMIVMQLLAASIGVGGFRSFGFTGVWKPMHLGSLFVASVLTAAAAAAGVMYLLGDRALRRKRGAGVLGGLPSLERLEALMQHAVLWAFVLLSLSIVTGVLILVGLPGGPVDVARWVKLYPALGSWVVFAIVLAVRLAPRFRGRSVAWLCILGFALLLSTYVVVQWQRMPRFGH